MTDVDRAVALLAQLAGAAPAPVLVFVHDGPPVAKERARFSPRNRMWYTPTTTRDAEEALAWKFKLARERFPDTVAIVTLFFVASPRIHKGDGDNMQKLVMDAGTKGGVWKDDKQVVAATWLLDVDEQHPRTVVAVCPYVNALTRAPLLMARERTA